MAELAEANSELPFEKTEGVVMFIVAYTLHTHPRGQAGDAGTLLAGCRLLETRAFSKGGPRHHSWRQPSCTASLESPGIWPHAENVHTFQMQPPYRENLLQRCNRSYRREPRGQAGLVCRILIIYSQF